MATTLLLPAKTLVLAGLLVLLTAGLVAMSHAATAETVPRWSAGRVPDASMRYTSASFSKAIRATFAVIYRPHRELDARGAHAPDFPQQLVYRGGTTALWDRQQGVD